MSRQWFWTLLFCAVFLVVGYIVDEVWYRHDMGAARHLVHK